MFANSRYMIIGKDFNENCKKLLIEVARLADNKSESSVSVMELNSQFDLERNEIKNYLEYLKEKSLIEIRSIGGPLLYGHISITNSGLQKIQELRKR